MNSPSTHIISRYFKLSKSGNRPPMPVPDDSDDTPTIQELDKPIVTPKYDGLLFVFRPWENAKDVV